MALGVRKGRSIMIVLAGGMTALTINCAAPRSTTRVPAEAGLPSPAYLRIRVSNTSMIYIVFHERDLRAAASVEGLKTAMPVRMLDVQGPEDNYPRFALPIPADQLPEGVAAVTTTCAYPRSGKVSGKMVDGQAYFHVAMIRTDENNTRWEFAPVLWEKANALPDKAPIIELPNPEKLSLAVMPSLPKTAPGKLAIVVHLQATGKALEWVDVKMDGKPTAAQVRLLDASGNEVASKKGALNDFGFT